jgi:hypothetical protein
MAAATDFIRLTCSEHRQTDQWELPESDTGPATRMPSIGKDMTFGGSYREILPKRSTVFTTNASTPAIVSSDCLEARVWDIGVSANCNLSK